jgi:hypothetical protein
MWDLDAIDINADICPGTKKFNRIALNIAFGLINKYIFYDYS